MTKVASGIRKLFQICQSHHRPSFNAVLLQKCVLLKIQ